MARNLGLQILRGIFSHIPTLLVGELYYATDTSQLYIGTSEGNQAVGGGGSTQQTVQATVTFPTVTSSIAEDTIAKTTVSATWVTSASILTCVVTDGPDHNSDEVAAEGVSATVGNIVPGVSFDVTVWAPNGTQGRHVINIQD